MFARSPRFAHPVVVTRVVLLIFALFLVASARADDPPRGPGLGTVRYVSEIRNVEGEADVDTFAAALIAGERLSVCVTAEASSALRPTLEVVDAGGRVLDVPAVTTRRGLRASIRNFTVACTALHGVRVSGAAGSAGGYTVRFSIRSPSLAASQRVSLSAADAPIRTLPFDSIDGAALDVLARSRAGRVSVLRVVTPDGFAAPGLSNALRRQGRTEVVADLGLSAGNGAYAVVVGTEDEVARADVRTRVAPPARPRGRIDLVADEPVLRPVAEPLPARTGERLVLSTRHVQAGPPPRVLLGGVEAAILGVSEAGEFIEVRVPETLTGGEVTSATLIAPDGQSNTRERHVRVVEVEFLDLSGWTLVQAASARTFSFPPGSGLTTGGYAIVARDAAQEDFEAYWGVVLGPRVRFLRSTDGGATSFPSINGSETFTLLDASGSAVDGETVALRSAGHESLARIAGTPAGDPASWVRDTDAVGVPTPGAGQPEDGTVQGIYISQISDAAGSGSFQNEFVEVYFAGGVSR